MKDGVIPWLFYLFFACNVEDVALWLLYTCTKSFCSLRLTCCVLSSETDKVSLSNCKFRDEFCSSLLSRSKFLLPKDSLLTVLLSIPASIRIAAADEKDGGKALI